MLSRATRGSLSAGLRRLRLGGESRILPRCILYPGTVTWDVYGARQISFFKKKPTWEPSDSHTSEACHQVARKLKEGLAGSNPLKELVLELVNVAPDHKIPDRYLDVVERALTRVANNVKKTVRGTSNNRTVAMTSSPLIGLLTVMTVEDIQQIYRAVVDSKSTLATKLYGLLYSSKVSPEDAFDNGLLYVKYLRSHNMIVESRKLMTALTGRTTDADKTVVRFLEVIKQFNPDAASVVSLFDSPTTLSTAVYHEAILVLAEIGDAEPFSKFINSLINLQLPVTEETIIIVLDSCLRLNADECGKRVLRTLVKPRIENLQIVDQEARLQYYELLVMACTKFGEDLATGKQIVSKIIGEFEERELVKETWDVLAQWTVYSSSDPAALEALVDKMQSHRIDPDETTLNEVLAVALGAAKRTDGYIDTVTNYFAQQEIDRDVKTFSLLIDRKLKSFDVESAQRLFEESIRLGCDWKETCDCLNKLLVALCTTPPVDTRNVFDVYQQIHMFTKQLDYSAQIELLKMFLSRNNPYDVARFTTEQFGERPQLSCQSHSELYHAIYDHLMTTASYRLAWDLYGILNRLIDLPYESYYPVMQRFCQLQRPDAALLIFRYLRARSKKEGIPSPTKEMYVLLFSEFGDAMYEEGVSDLQAYLRTDLSTDTDITIMNAILGAYCQLQDPTRTNNTWLEINGFPAGMGVNNDTITIMLKHLTRFSLPEVEQLWVSFPDTYGLQPNAENLRQYVIANCYHGYYMRALELTKRMKETYGIEPTDDIIEALYNWSMLDTRKKQVEKWALEQHPEKWKRLQARNVLKSYVLPPNPDNDSEASLRGQTIELIEGHGNDNVPDRQ
jgi:hypothetical protein